MSSANTSRRKPRLETLDGLFLLNRSLPLQNEFNSSPLRLIHINYFMPFPNHPFRLYVGERLDDMVESIKKHGILNPIIVRELDGEFQILSGHNRVNAATIAGLTDIPAIVKENITDDEAWVYVIETNLIQRSFSDMAHSEKAAVIAAHHSKLFSQGKRNDILNEVKRLEKPHEYRVSDTYAQIEHKSNSRNAVAQEYGLDRNTVARYLRIFQLISELKLKLDDGEIGFIPAVTLSFLNEVEQAMLVDHIRMGFKVDMKKADLLREYSGKGKLNEDNMYLILDGEIKLQSLKKPNRTPTVKVRKDVYSKYFRPEQSQQEVQGIVEEALELYFSRKKYQ